MSVKRQNSLDIFLFFSKSSYATYFCNLKNENKEFVFRIKILFAVWHEKAKKIQVCCAKFNILKSEIFLDFSKISRVL